MAPLGRCARDRCVNLLSHHSLFLQLLNSDSVIQAHIVIMGQKRKRSCSRSAEAENACDLLYNFDQSAPPTFSTNVAVKHLQPVGVGEGNERPGRKRRRAGSGQKVKVEDHQGTAQRSTEGESHVMPVWFSLLELWTSKSLIFIFS